MTLWIQESVVLPDFELYLRKQLTGDTSYISTGIFEI